MFVRELEDGQAVEQVLLVRDTQRRSTRNGSDYLRLVLGDQTGTLVAVLWDCPEDTFDVATVGVPVHVTGRYGVHERYGPQLKLTGVRPAGPEEYDLDALLDAPAHDAQQMERGLREVIDTIQSPHLRALLDHLLGPGTPTWEAFRDAPAAKRNHQAYKHGLLEHCLGVAEAVHGIAVGDTFPDVDHDIAVTGALLHDIGKLEAYAFTGAAIEMSDAGKLQGEIPLGYYRVRQAIEALPDFPPELGQAVLHIILSHHGSLEHGSPVVPCTREATLVHMIDNLGGRLGSFDRLQKELPAGARWSGYDRALDSSAYFAQQEAA